MQVNFTWGHVKDLRGKEIADLRKAKADLHIALDIMTDRAQAAEQQLTAEREVREKAESMIQRLVTVYTGMEDGDGNPCPELAAAAAFLNAREAGNADK